MAWFWDWKKQLTLLLDTVIYTVRNYVIAMTKLIPVCPFIAAEYKAE